MARLLKAVAKRSLKILPRLLIENIYSQEKEERKKHNDIIRDSQNFKRDYTALVHDTQHKLDLFVPSFKSAIEDTEFLRRILSSDTGDKNDIKIAWKCITVDSKNLFKLAETSIKSSNDLSRRYQHIATSISKQKLIIQQRSQSVHSFQAVVAGGYIVATSLVNIIYFGGGHGLSFLRLKIIIATAVIGGSMFSVIRHVLTNLLKKRDKKMFDDLNQTLSDLSKLNDDHCRFKRYIEIFHVNVAKSNNEIKRITATIESNNEPFITKSKELCGDFIVSIRTLILSVKEIKNIDVSKWEEKIGPDQAIHQ